MGFVIIAGTEVAEVHFQLKARNKEITYLLMQPPIVIRSKMGQNATFSASPSAVRCHVYPCVFWITLYLTAVLQHINHTQNARTKRVKVHCGTYKSLIYFRKVIND